MAFRAKRDNLQPLPFGVFGEWHQHPLCYQLLLSLPPAPSHVSMGQGKSVHLHKERTRRLQSLTITSLFMAGGQVTPPLFSQLNGLVPTCLLCGQVLQQYINHLHAMKML